MRARGAGRSKSTWPMLSLPVDGFSFTNVDAPALQHMNEPHIDALALAFGFCLSSVSGDCRCNGKGIDERPTKNNER